MQWCGMGRDRNYGNKEREPFAPIWSQDIDRCEARETWSVCKDRGHPAAGRRGEGSGGEGGERGMGI